MTDHIGLVLASIHGTQAAAWLIPVGYVGVLAFFVHTSIVLMLSLERLAEFPRLLAVRFYVRRAFRIYPLSILCVLSVLLLKVPVFPSAGAEFHLPSAIVRAANLLLVQNLVGKESVSGPLWSLPFEVQMYVALPLCFYLFAGKRKGLLYLACCMVAFACIGSVVKHFTGHANILAFIPCFLSGVVAFTMRHRIRPRLASAAWPCFLFLWVAAYIGLTLRWPAFDMQTGWLACLLLGLSIYAFRDCRNAWWNRITHRIAEYSYGVYLGHVPMLWLVFNVWRITGSVLGIVVWLIMTALLAVITYHLLEKPMIEVGRKLTARMEQTNTVPAVVGQSS
jgi:peptidoglycan/LPS O-acetylase OafA/YrhL